MKDADEVIRESIADHVPGPTPYGTDLPMLPEHTVQQMKGATEELQANPDIANKLLQDHAKMIQEAGVLQSDEEIKVLMVQATTPIMETVEEIKRNQIRMVHGLTQAHIETTNRLNSIITILEKVLFPGDDDTPEPTSDQATALANDMARLGESEIPGS
jgi:hypothetical protein